MASKKIISLLTDFGLKDPYVGVMKAVIYSINPDAVIVDLTHDIPRHDVDTAAMVLLVSYKYFPRETIYVCVVDPGVGTRREAILIVTRNYYFIGPNNGCLYSAAVDDGILEVYDISSTRYSLPRVSHTFHGRDLFSPVAAYLSKGVEPSQLGRLFTGELVKPSIKGFVREGNCVKGYIGYVDGFGNLMTNINDIPWSYGERLRIEYSGGVIECLFTKSFGYVEPGEYVCYVNSWGFFEIAVNKGSAYEKTGLRTGDPIRVCSVET